MPRQSRKLQANVEEITEMQTTPPSGGSPGTSGVPEHIIKFLNALPVTGDVLQWIEGFREALRLVLGDVDRISVKINTNCDLANPNRSQNMLEINQHMVKEKNSPETFEVTTGDKDKVGEQVIKEFREQGHPIDDYHPPHYFDYYYEGKAYIGTLLLLRDRSKTPISAKTVETMKALEQFILFALSDLVTRHYYARPIDRVFYDLLLNMVREAGLSSQDMRILSLMLLGYSYKQVGDKMDVTIDTVRKHMKRIYRKTRTGSLAELFAKYFTPRLGIQGLGEEDSL